MDVIDLGLHLLLTALFIISIPTASIAEAIYESKKQAWEDCLDWWKEGGNFYVQEAEG